MKKVYKIKPEQNKIYRANEKYKENGNNIY